MPGKVLCSAPKQNSRSARTAKFSFLLVISYALTAPIGANAGGLVLVFDKDSGSFEARRQAKGFARNFGPDGTPLGVEPEQVPPPDEKPAAVEAPRPVMPRREIEAAIYDTAMRYAGHGALRTAGLSVTEWLRLFRANIEIESGYNQSAISRTGAIGLGQLMPGTAAKLGVDPRNVHQNLDGSARYLLMLLDRFGSKELALAGYNAGPEAVTKYGGVPPYAETRGHVRKVMTVFHRLTIAMNKE